MQARQARPFEIAPEARSPRQAALVERISAGPRQRVPINLRAWLHNPDFVDVVEPFGLYVSELAAMSKRQKEIVVLIVAHFWRAEYALAMHAGHARKHGIGEAQIAALCEGRRPDFADPVESLTWELAHTLIHERQIGDDLYRRAFARFGHKGVPDLIGLIGLYTMIAMTLNFYDVPGPDPAPRAAP